MQKSLWQQWKQRWSISKPLLDLPKADMWVSSVATLKSIHISSAARQLGSSAARQLGILVAWQLKKLNNLAAWRFGSLTTEYGSSASWQLGN
jgi:hypothetical protein